MTKIATVFALILSLSLNLARGQGIGEQERALQEHQSHDAAADGANLTKCSTLDQKTEEKYNEHLSYLDSHQKQLLGEIAKERDRLSDEDRASDILEGVIDDSVGQQNTNVARDPNTSAGDLENEQDNVVGAVDQLENVDATNQVAFEQSGCKDWDPNTGECKALSGVVFEQNEKLKELANRGVAAAADFARTQQEKLRAFRNEKCP